MSITDRRTICDSLKMFLPGLWWCMCIHCLLLIIIVCRCLCVQYRILLMLPLFLINKCTEAVIMADITCISCSHVSVTGLATSGAGPGKFVLLCCRVMYGALWARSLMILILSVSHCKISCNHGQLVASGTNRYLQNYTSFRFCELSHFILIKIAINWIGKGMFFKIYFYMSYLCLLSYEYFDINIVFLAGSLL